jgi:hypothetical protein
MPARREQAIPVEGSWRVVEGENDSFDTTVLRDEDEDELVMSTDPSQLEPTQLSGSQPFSIGGSQDDQLETFLDKAEKDERVIMRSPFRPSIPQSVRQASRENMRSAEPEFHYPTVDVGSPRRGVGTRAALSRTGRPAEDPGMALRRRQLATRGGSTKATPGGGRDQGPRGFFDRFGDSFPDALFNILAWFYGLIALAFNYAQKPLAIFLALYTIFGGLIMAQNMVTKSIHTSLSPLCKIPGASYLDLPFCPTLVPKDGSSPEPVEFKGLMDVQDRFEEVLEKSAQGVSMPMEMKRSEASVRDLRTMVRYSDLQSKEELLLEFDGFVDAARIASNDLQRFNTHVGSAVDSVISINRWTSRYLDGLAAERESKGALSAWVDWAFAPFQPATFSDRNLVDQYVQHTALVGDKIGDLIIEAQAVLRTLSRAEDHLGIIYDFVTRTQESVQGRKDEILWTLWTLVGANSRDLHNLNKQLSLLRQVDTQRAGAVRQVNDLILELQNIQSGLGDLRDRVAEPELTRHKVHVPLSVHIETIDKGVERLERARGRIRAVEDDRINEVLARGRTEERLIESS